MVTLMQRRRAMMRLASVGPTGPLYQFHQGTYSYIYRVLTISNGNHIQFTTSANSRTAYANGTTMTSSAIASPVWFTLHAGDVLVSRATNIVVTGGNTRNEYSIKDANNVTVIAIYQPQASGISGEQPDQERTVTLASDVDITSASFFQYRSCTVDLDYELWVNGIRYL